MAVKAATKGLLEALADGADFSDPLVKKGRENYFEERAYNQRLKASKKKQPLPKAERVTVADMEHALVKYKGNLSKAAKSLGMTRNVFKRKVQLYPSLEKLIQDLREEVVDKAEGRLFEQVDEGYFPAVSMVLKTLGKERGYSERVVNESELGPNATKTAAALIEAMRKGKIEEDAVSPKEIEASEWKVVEEQETES